MPDPVAPAPVPGLNVNQQVGSAENAEIVAVKINTYVAVYLVGSGTAAGAPRPRPASPYKFLSSYTVDDQDIFFGREKLCAELCPLLLGNPRITLAGRAGIGKSSLVHAALIPAAARSGGALAFSISDYAAPFDGIRNAVRTAAARIGGLDLALPEEDSLAPIVSAWAVQTGRPFVLFFDQFERLLSLPIEQQGAFANPVLDALARNPGLFHVVYVLRQDLVERARALGASLDQPDLLGEIQEIPGLDHDQVTRAFIGPLHREGEYDLAKIQQGLVDDHMLPDLDSLDGSQDGMIEPAPFQIVCTRLYEQARAKAGPGDQPFLSIALYRDDLGGCDGILKNFLSAQKEKLGASDAEWRNILGLLAAMAKSNSLPFYPIPELAGQVGLPADRIRGWLERLEQQRLVQPRADLSYALSGSYLVRLIRDWLPDQFNKETARERLERAHADWRDHGLLVDPTRLRSIETAQSLVSFSPSDLMLLLRSAVEFESGVNFWLGKMSSDSASHALVSRLASGDSGDPETAQAASVLGIGTGGPATLVEAAVRSPTESIRTASSLALSILGAEKVLEWLRPFLRSHNTRDRLAASWAIAWIRLYGAGGDWSPFVSPRLVPFLVPLLRLRSERVQLLSVAASAMVGTILVGLVLALAHIVVVLGVGLPNIPVEFLSSLAVGVVTGGVVGTLYGVGDAAGSPRRRWQKPVARAVGVMAGFALANGFLLAAAAPDGSDVGLAPILIGILVGSGFAAGNEHALERFPGRRAKRVLYAASGLAASAALATIAAGLATNLLRLSLENRVYWDFAGGLNPVIFIARMGEGLPAFAAWLSANTLSGGIIGAGLAGGLAAGDWLAAELTRARYV